MSTFRPAFPIPNSSSLLNLRTRLSCFSYRIAVAGVRKKEPATIVAINGRPNKANGCLASPDRYRDAIVLASLAERNFLFPNTAIAGTITALPRTNRQLCMPVEAIEDGEYGGVKMEVEQGHFY